MLAAFNDVMDETVEVELKYVSEALRKNVSLLYTLSGLIKQDALVSLLDGRGRQVHEARIAEEASTVKVLQLRRSASKWKDLKLQPAVIHAVLQAMEPGWYTQEGHQYIDFPFFIDN